MKKISKIFSMVMFVMLMVATMVGCESADGYSIDVSVSSYSVGEGGKVYLSATGWSDYTWSLSDPSLGSLNAYNGSSVVYTSHASSGTQTITITARGSGATTTTTTTNNNSSSTDEGEKENEARTTTTTSSSPLVRTIQIAHE